MNKAMSSKKLPILETDEFRLVPLSGIHKPIYKKAFLCKRTTRYIDRAFSKDEVDKNFDVALNSLSSINYLIVLKRDNLEVGFIGVQVCSKQMTAELGFMLMAKKAPKGTARLTAIMLINYLFNYLGLNKIVFVTSIRNKAAIRACLTIGTDFSGSPIKQNPQIGVILKKNWQFSDVACTVRMDDSKYL
ncbi:GNAT family N-acetyltransferase [Aliikangiella sp. G2MR2-5]|uniref:GNAT family N-acetyltransferase n=1 Tax=Aliikangiella sp. G2MR2-5 TaxID=2788943 RepID=UPI0018AB26B9|nr:GNAT family N-acetyltransferase [Aliikangiella sp. G2MR2-5]